MLLNTTETVKTFQNVAFHDLTAGKLCTEIFYLIPCKLVVFFSVLFVRLFFLLKIRRQETVLITVYKKMFLCSKYRLCH